MEQTTVDIEQSRLNMQAVPLASSIFEASKDPTSQRYKTKWKKRINVDPFLEKKMIQKSVRLIWSAEK